MAEAKEKTGCFTGAYAINPVNKELVPIYIADYVLTGYGTGAIMAVPAHDERDFEFAKKFQLPIVHVVSRGTGFQPVSANHGLETRATAAAFTEEGVAINSDFLNGMTTPAAKARML